MQDNTIAAHYLSLTKKKKSFRLHLHAKVVSILQYIFNLPKKNEEMEKAV